jgi:hypothetical protein
MDEANTSKGIEDPTTDVPANNLKASTGSSSADSFLSLARTDETFSIFLGFLMLLIAGISRVDFMLNDMLCGSRGLWFQLEYMFLRQLLIQ